MTISRWIVGTAGVVAGTLLGASLAISPAGAQEKKAPHQEMTTYYVAFLYRGPSWTPQVTPEVETLQKEHLANIGRLAAAGKLILAGPFSDDGKLRGMFVLQVGTLEEAKATCDTDPMVKAGRLAVELHPWFSARGIRVDPPTTKEDAGDPHGAK